MVARHLTIDPPLIRCLFVIGGEVDVARTYLSAINPMRS